MIPLSFSIKSSKMVRKEGTDMTRIFNQSNRSTAKSGSWSLNGPLREGGYVDSGDDGQVVFSVSSIRGFGCTMRIILLMDEIGFLWSAKSKRMVPSD